MVSFTKFKRPPTLLLYLLLLLPFLFGIAYMIGFNQKAQAAILVDSSSSSNGATSWTHTVKSEGTILIVGVDKATAVKYGTLSLTRAVGTNTTASLWYLKDPPVGSATIAVTGSTAKYLGATTFSNVDLENPIGTTGTNNTNIGSNFCTNTLQTNGTPIEIKFTTASTAGGGLIGGGGPMKPTSTGQVGVDYINITLAKAYTTFNPGSSQTLLMSNRLSSNKEGVGMSTIPAAATQTTMSWTYGCPNGGSQSLAVSGAAIALNVTTITPTPIPPTLTPTPTIAPTPTPAPIQGNITNLNFGISNASPWMQVNCGDVRIDSGVNNPLPAGQSMITSSTSCTTPGLVYTGNTTASFGEGQASSTNQVVGGSLYPEEYTQSGIGGLFSSFDSIYSKAQLSGVQPIDLSSICTLSNCTLPPNLPHGVYLANSDMTLNAYTFPANQNYVILVRGNLTINGNVIAQSGTNSSLLISTSGNIIIPPTVGSPATSTSPNLAGIFSTDKSFIIQSNNNCTDLRLNIEGSVIINAGLIGGTLQNNRDLCSADATSPTLSLTQRLDFVFNLPDFVKQQSVTSQEVAP